MQRGGEQFPIQGRVKIPFLPLPELAPHEECFLPRPSPLQSKKSAQVGQAFGRFGQIHLVGKGTLSVNNLVMRKSLHEVLRELIGRPESQFVMLAWPFVWGRPEIAQDVVHPSHVPLEVKPQSPGVRRLGNHGEGG